MLAHETWGIKISSNEIASHHYVILYFNIIPATITLGTSKEDCLLIGNYQHYLQENSKNHLLFFHVSDINDNLLDIIPFPFLRSS